MSVIVFTTIFGGSDSLKPAPKGVRAVCFTDASHADDKGWELVPYAVGDPRRAAWNLRCVPNVPHVDFDAYDRSVWIDASFTLTDLPRLLKDSEHAEIAALRHHARQTCYQEAREIVSVGQASKPDVQPQMERYQREGFHGAPLSISCILVRKNTDRVRAFNETWAKEIATHRGDNTQLSLDYSAWRNNLWIHGLEGTRHKNPYAVHDHDDHKKRRKPYATAVQR